MSTLRASGIVAAITAGSRVLGFLRWLVFSACVGAGVVGSAYSTANSVPNVLYEIAAGGALAAVVVPLVGEALGRGSTDDVDAIASTLLTAVCGLLGPMALLVWYLAEPIARLLVPPGPDAAATVTLASSMLRWFAPQVLLYGVGVVCAGVLQAHGRFVAAAVAPLLSSVVAIATYGAYTVVRTSVAEPGPTAVAVLAGGTTLGVVALSVPLLVPVRSLGIRLRPSLHLPPGTGRRAAALTTAGVLALLAQQLALVVTIRVANACAGALTVYQYAQAVYLLPYAVLAVPIATAVYPALASGATDAPARLGSAVRVVVVACGVAGAGLVGAAGSLGRFFGALDASRHVTTDIAGAMTALVMTLAPGLVGYGPTALLVRALYVRGHPQRAGAWVAAGWLLAATIPLLAAPHDIVGRLAVVGLGSTAGMLVTGVGLAAQVARSWPQGTLAGSVRSTVAAAGGLVGGALVGAGLDHLVAGDGLVRATAGGTGCGLAAAAVAVAVAGVIDRTTLAALVSRVRRTRVSTPAPIR